jgi:ribosomal protein S18 acetylase RimI-like enzyme
MSSGYPGRVLIDSRPVIRPATRADETAITVVRRASWFAAYDGIIDHAIIDRITRPGTRPVDPPPYHRTIVAVSHHASPKVADQGVRDQAEPVRGERVQEAAAGSGSADAELVIGYATFGPERVVLTAVPPAVTASRGGGSPRPPVSGPLTSDGLAGLTGELYALYLEPAWWSAGVGRALTETVLATLWEDGYRRVVLWVLTGNARARRFYERAGFRKDGTKNVLTGIGAIEELRYAREL